MLNEKDFDPESVAPETVGINEILAQTPALPLDIGAIRELMEQSAAATAPDGVPYRSPRARLVELGEGTPPLRVMPPGTGQPRGIYAHAHGGGWSFGSAADHDAEFEALADASGYAVVSLDYRLAPEHPFPIPLQDAARGIRALRDGVLEIAGPVVVGGESAGANLVLSAVIGERDAGRGVPAGMILYYGAYDLTGTPSLRSFGTGFGMIDSASLSYFYDLYTADTPADDPAVSPLYADLSGLPAALLLVGTKDPLLDDTTFLSARLRSAGVPVEVHVAPGGAHGFNFFPIPAAAAATEAHVRFLAEAG